ncbi:MAG: glycosyltransferase family 2 protein [Bacilli bacterium]|nr:glycosyltransferase family 2 protein [Bacilli bacterium]
MIDIIIPVYNTPLNDLERCLDSIVNQTFKNYIVYIIDDGSNINTKEYIDNYIKDKSNFIAKHIKNNGVSNARNIGIDLSSSKYIAFVDSDDTLKKSFLEEAYYLIKDNNLDIIIGGYNEIKNDSIIRVRLSEPGLHIYENDDIVRFLDKLLTSKANKTNKEIGNAPVGRIYTRLFKRESIGNLRFNTNIHMSEDTLFMIDYTYRAKKIGVVDRIWYNYFINNYSISRSTKKEKMIKNIKDFLGEIEFRKSIENNKILKDAYQYRINKTNNYLKKIKNAN